MNDWNILQKYMQEEMTWLEFTLTINSFDSVGNIQFETGCQCSEERCGIVGALEALSGLLEALTVVHLQVHHRAVERKTNTWTIVKHIVHSESLKL